MATNKTKLTEIGSLVDRLVVLIRDAIIKGDFEPSSHIGIKKIADQHGVSMIPVREALARLLSSRLVVAEPNRGYFVASKPTPAEFAQFVQFRELFETSAVALGFDNVTDFHIKSLTALNEKMRKVAKANRKNAMAEWGQLNSEFHQILVGLAGNQFISAQYENLAFGQMHFQLARAYEVEFTSMDLLIDQHDTMIEALTLRDKDKMLDSLSAHINNLNLTA